MAYPGFYLPTEKWKLVVLLSVMCYAKREADLEEIQTENPNVVNFKEDLALSVGNASEVKVQGNSTTGFSEDEKFGEIVENLQQNNISSNISLDTNTTEKVKHRWNCKPFNISSNSSTLIMSNDTKISEFFSQMNKSNGCALLLFYSPYCQFCADMASLYNAVGRLYDNIAVVAIDAQEVMSLAARYGVVGLPTVFFFYSGKAVARFNRTRTPSNFEKFVKQLSGIEPKHRIEVLDVDKEGPLSSVVKESKDFYMIFSVSFSSLFLYGKVLGKRTMVLMKKFHQYCTNLLTHEKVD